MNTGRLESGKAPIPGWCNGSTPAFGADSLGSSPRPGTRPYLECQMSALTVEQKAYNHDETIPHINDVRRLLKKMAIALLDRGEVHDQTKLESPEVEIFADKSTPQLGPITYDSPEYRASRERVKPALQHHYAHNRHHPEHFKNGVEDMNLLDILEMFCDWSASSKRHHNGNIRKSIEANADRFKLSPQLVKILENTIEAL